MEILNNRASTKAQIQKFDTMMEQIQVRKSQINREILANDSEIAEENENLNKYQMELKVISDKIIALNNENKEYESNIKTLQAQISRESQKLQIGQSAFHREQSRLESLRILQNVMTDTVTVFVKLWIIRTVRRDFWV